MKHTFYILAALIAATLGFCSCTTTKYISAQPEVEAAWVGKTYAEIVKANGAPMRETSDGAGGVILVYENVRSFADTYAYNYGPYYGPYYNHGTNLNTEIRNETDYINFFIGEDLTCYMVKTNLMTPTGKEINTGATLAASVGGAAIATLILVTILR